MIITIIRCDGCDKDLDKVKDKYKLDLTTDRFWDGTEMGDRIETLHFCRQCALDVKETLKEIANRKTTSYIDTL